MLCLPEGSMCTKSTHISSISGPDMMLRPAFILWLSEGMKKASLPRRQAKRFRQCALPSNSVPRAQSSSRQTAMSSAAMPTWRLARQGPGACSCQFKPRSAGHLFSNRSRAQHTESSWNCLHPQQQHRVLATARAAPHAAGNEPQTFTEDDVIDVNAEVHKAPLIPVTVSSGCICA